MYQNAVSPTFLLPGLNELWMWWWCLAASNGSFLRLEWKSVPYDNFAENIYIALTYWRQNRWIIWKYLHRLVQTIEVRILGKWKCWKAKVMSVRCYLSACYVLVCVKMSIRRSMYSWKRILVGTGKNFLKSPPSLRIRCSCPGPRRGSRRRRCSRSPARPTRRPSRWGCWNPCFSC